MSRHSAGNQNLDEPQISFCVPAFHGPSYLFECLTSIQNLDDGSFECIVGVSSNDSDCRQVVEEFLADDRFLLRDYGAPDVPMAPSYENLIGFAKGEWISVVGQDDGVLPWFFDEVKSLIRRWPDVEAFSFRRAYFFWPGVEDIYGDKAWQISARPRTKVRNSRNVIAGCLLGFMEHYELPQTYTNNLINARVISRIKKFSGGRFYREPIPDTYSGVAVGMEVREFVYSETPVFWTGTSAPAAGYEGHQPVTPIVKRKSHRDRWQEFGYRFPRVPGEQLWLSLGGSELFVLSSLNALPTKKSLRFMRAWSIIALSSSWLRILSSAKIGGQPTKRRLLDEWRHALRLKCLGASCVALFGILVFLSGRLIFVSRKLHGKLLRYQRLRRFHSTNTVESKDKTQFNSIQSVNRHLINTRFIDSLRKSATRP